MGMSFLDLKAEFVANIARPSFDTTRAGRYINWGQKFVARQGTFREMIYEDTSMSTTSGFKSYPYPTRLKELFSMRLLDGANSRKLELYTVRRFDRDVPYPEQFSTGRPIYYIDKGPNFDLNRIPDAAYHLNLVYARFPVDLSGNSDTSMLVDKDDLILAAATMFALITIRAKDEAQAWGQTFNFLWDSVISGEVKKVDWLPEMVKTQPVSFLGEYWKNPAVGVSGPR